MYDLIQCLLGTCQNRNVVQLLVDLLGPMLLDIFVISFLVDLIVKRREEKKWEPSVHMLYAKLLKLQDKLLLDLVPPSYKMLKIQEVSIGKISVNIFFMWKNNLPNRETLASDIDDYLIVKKGAIFSNVSYIKDQIDNIIMAHSSHMDSYIFNSLLDMEDKINLLISYCSSESAFNSQLVEVIDISLDVIYKFYQMRDWLLRQKAVCLT